MDTHSKPASAVEDKILTKDFLLLFMAHLFFGFSFWPFVLLPAHLQNLGADLIGIGLIMGSASVSGILTRPFIGVALDRVGRKRCLLGGCLLVVLASLLYIPVKQLGWAIYATRLLHGLGMGMLMATFFTLAADLAPPGKRTQSIALFGIAGHLSGVIGVPLGEQILLFGGFEALFVSCSGFALLSMLISTRATEPAPGKLSGQSPSTDPSVMEFLRGILLRENAVPLLGTCLFALVLTSYMVFLKPFVLKSGTGLVSFFFVAYSLTAVIVRLIGGDWPDRFGLKRVLYPSLIAMSLGLFLIPLMPSSRGLLLSGILCGIGHGFVFPILSVMLIHRAPDAKRGSRMALFTLFFDIGIFIGGPFWGSIAKIQGYKALYFLSAALLLVCWLSFVFFDRVSGRADDAL